MFKRNVQTLDNVINQFLRKEGLETPLLQKRLIDAWETVTGAVVERYTGEKFIKNQTLFVKINNPALRSDLSMMRSELVRKLNAEVGSMLITDVRIF
jgi:predicted nucleic acid-binding Zn ribbon protein